MTNHIVQTACGKLYSEMLDLTSPRLKNLYSGAAIHRHDRAAHEPLRRIERHPMWDKVHWLNVLANELPDGDLLAYFDCDVLPLAKIDFAAALAGRDFAAVRNVSGIFNCGMVIFRMSLTVRAALQWMENQGPLPSNPWEEDIFNMGVAGRLRTRDLPRNYNNYRNAAPQIDTSLPIFNLAWHGQGASDALKMMKEAVNEAA